MQLLTLSFLIRRVSCEDLVAKICLQKPLPTPFCRRSRGPYPGAGAEAPPRLAHHAGRRAGQHAGGARQVQRPRQGHRCGCCYPQAGPEAETTFVSQAIELSSTLAARGKCTALVKATGAHGMAQFARECRQLFSQANQWAEKNCASSSAQYSHLAFNVQLRESPPCYTWHAQPTTWVSAFLQAT